MTKKKGVKSRRVGVPVGSRGLRTTKEQLKAAQKRVVDLTTEMAKYRTYFDQGAYVRQLQGELRALEEKHEELKEQKTNRERSLEFDIRQLEQQRDALIGVASRLNSMMPPT
jgi:maltooligosyltrehalose synthase